MKLMLDYCGKNYLQSCIQNCQEKKHIQQVAFSTYHDALTQICFTCEIVRTSISDSEIKKSRKDIKTARIILKKLNNECD